MAYFYLESIVKHTHNPKEKDMYSKNVFSANKAVIQSGSIKTL